MEDNISKMKEKFDLNGDNSFTPEEIDAVIKMRDYENKDQKAEAQKSMAWYALFSMILYPFLILVASYLGLDKSAQALVDIAGVYFGSVAVIVAVFMGAEAYKNKIK